MHGEALDHSLHSPSGRPARACLCPAFAVIQIPLWLLDPRLRGDDDGDYDERIYAMIGYYS
jgi:hypothetical protein